MMLNYETLRLIWWGLLGILFIGFTIMDGFDVGTAILLPFVAKSDQQRRIVINTIGPIWESNQVWLILGAGATFAAWPYIYSVAFSGFYFAMFLALITLILRPVAIKYRSKMPHAHWRAFWDWTLCVCGIGLALLFGVAVGNVLQGVPFYFDDSLRLFYTGSFWQLLNPFALLCSILSVTMLCMHGGLYLAIKTDNEIKQKAIRYSRVSAFLVVLLFALAGWGIALQINGYITTSPIDFLGPANPLHKTVIEKTGAWLNNYYQYHWMLLAPLIGFIGALTAGIKVHNTKFAFISSSFSLFGIITTIGLSMFPFILPSSSQPDMSLLVWDASSSQLTLMIMLIATVVFLPIILGYTGWVYYIMRGKVTKNYIDDNEGNAY